MFTHASRFACAALLAVAVPAAAQDAEPAAAPSFTGVRVEAIAGWDQLRFDLADYGLTGTNKESGLAYGAVIGFDAPLGPKLVGGLEAGASWSSNDDGFTNGTTSYGYELGRDLHVAGRLGLRAGDSALLYAKAGYTNLRVNLATTDATTATTISTRTNLDGLLLGVGAELGLGPSAYVKGEYSYSNYEDDVSRNRIMTGIGFRF